MTQQVQSSPVTPIPTVATVLEQLATILLGKQDQIEMALACMLARGHLLIEDVPGTGKTTLAQAMGTLMGLDWNRVQFTSDLLPADIVGVSIFNSHAQDFEFRKGPVFTSVLLADEINRSPPKAQSALLEAMEERQVTVDGITYSLPDNFFVIATQNPTEQLGAYPLPESQLDRFLVGLSLGYPDPEAELNLMKTGDRRDMVNQIKPVANATLLQEWAGTVSNVHVSDTVFLYIQALLKKSRESGTGLSSRAGLSLVRLCKAMAFIANRDHVLLDDVQRAFPALAGHRLTGKVGTGATAAQAILNDVAVS